MDSMQIQVLIVDDNPKNLQVLARTIEQLKYHVEFSLDGESALQWIRKRKFDLILLDIIMPGLNGLEVCRKIREDHAYDDVPVIFLSAETEKETILEGFEIGAQDYITKPFDSRELLARVKTQLELKAGREHLKKVNQWLEEQVRIRTAELEKSNRELEAANRELLDLDRLKNEFLNIIGHEVRTSLNGILGSVQLLRKKMEGARLSGLIRILDQSLARFERFSTTALLITELKSGRRKMQLKHLLLASLVRHIKIRMSGSMRLKKINLKVRGIPDDLVIMGDENLLLICLENILENALGFSPEGGVITIKAGQIKDLVFCEISDQGRGFSDTALKYLFKPFVPGEPHIDENIGLDLSLASMIMDAHSGKIEVENLEPSGAMVRLIFRNSGPETGEPVSHPERLFP